MTDILAPWDGSLLRALRFQDDDLCELAADEIERLHTLIANIPKMVEGWDTAHIDPDGTVHYSGIGKQIARDIREALEGK